MRFTDKTAIVTGAGRGIGAATAHRLAAEGARVLLVSRTGDELDAVAAQIGPAAATSVADVASAADVDRVVATAVEHWGRIDVLVNNAGIDHDSPFLDFPEERWNAVLGVNLTGPFLMAQRACRVMAGQGGGSVVHVASIDAYGADGEQVAYNVSKAGLLGLNRTMATELAPQGIRSNVVCPGYTATPLTRQYVGERMYEHMTTAFARVPQGRMATVEEIAAGIAFLASGDATAITGTELVIDGGTLANLYVVETLPE
jgi:NAD(P)-dependent dehydrogenase (short-subunit alcohol dehydrogenase family)